METDISIVKQEGRIVNNPKLHNEHGRTPVTTFTIASNRKNNKSGKEHTSFILCEAFNKKAKDIFTNYTAGTKVIVEGKLHQVQKIDNGQKKYKVVIRVDEIKNIER